MLKRYGEELQSVFDELIRMASYAVGAVRKAQAALERGDAAAAKNIVEGDENVNRFEKEIEQRALRIIIKYQPVANDLRDVTGALKMITDIERIGDQAADIASVFLKIGEAVKDDDLSAMFAHVADMATAAVNAAAYGYLNTHYEHGTGTMHTHSGILSPGLLVNLSDHWQLAGMMHLFRYSSYTIRGENLYDELDFSINNGVSLGVYYKF